MRLLFYKHLFSCIYLLKTDSYTVYIFRSPAHRRSVQSLFYPKIAIIIRRGLYLCKLHVYSRSDRVDPIIEISNVYIADECLLRNICGTFLTTKAEYKLS